MSGWAEHARAAINRVNDRLPDGVTLAERIKAVDAAYPFGERSCWPYKARLKARRAYLVRHGWAPKNQKPTALDFLPRDPVTGRPML